VRKIKMRGKIFCEAGHRFAEAGGGAERQFRSKKVRISSNKRTNGEKSSLHVVQLCVKKFEGWESLYRYIRKFRKKVKTA